MPDSQFTAGRKLRTVWVNSNSGFTTRGVPRCGRADSIEVVLECGQMSMVPWALVLQGHKRIMVNLALAQEVELEEDGNA